MKHPYWIFVASCWIVPSGAVAQSFKADIAPLVKAACIDCHDADTETRLNFEQLSYDLADANAFRQWEKIFDRVKAGEMPPKSEPRPDATQLKKTLGSLERSLRETNLARQRKSGRVSSRRLTRLEYAYTIRDLLLIEDDLATLLPAESDSGGFDTVGATQRTSPVHIRSYLKAADRALDAAINLRRRPATTRRLVDYLKSPYVNMWYDRPLRRGGRVIKKLDDAVALFVDLDYVLRSDASGFHIRSPGRYRITVEAYAYQAKTPVTLKLILASEKRGGAKMLGAFDLLPDQSRKVEVTTLMKPGDYLYPSVADLDRHGSAGVYGVGGAKNYKGEGIAIKSLHVEGPLVEQWPPASTQLLLTGVELKKQALGSYQVGLTKEPIAHVADVVKRIAPLAFRRPPVDGEVESFVDLARPAIADGRQFTDAVRVPLRSILSSPQFLFFAGEPGELDDFALASRLSYFLWKSMPDEELFGLAKAGRLSDPTVLARQVDRMLNDKKSIRFIQDFLGQWLRLYDINATTPDVHLYPEYDDVLNQAIVKETELFFAELIEKNLSVSNLIDSDFTFLNRRLADHYGIRENRGKKITGQQFQKVTLPKDSPRGGVLTQASVLKVTANGTVTSPVTRGIFVLTNLLGTPPDPPLPNVGSIEPDTRGKTTIRETLAAHRNSETCARCHREIDPPGFALESFDPIGGFRTRYRATSGRQIPFQSILRFKAYNLGPRVDASGVTAEGKKFSGIVEFKKHLLEQQDQIAHHFISQLIVYATGAEIQFADREQVAEIAKQTRQEGYPVRTIIHKIVQSTLFRNK